MKEFFSFFLPRYDYVDKDCGTPCIILLSAYVVVSDIRTFLAATANTTISLPKVTGNKTHNPDIRAEQKPYSGRRKFRNNNQLFSRGG